MRLIATVQSNLEAKIAATIAAVRTGLKASAPAAAQLFVEEAQTIVPVLTGNLQKHIRAVQTEDSDTRQVFAVTPTVDAENEYGFDPAYARRIEFGFIGTDKLGRRYHQPAQPYMRPAFDSQQEAAAGVLTSGVREAVQGVK